LYLYRIAIDAAVNETNGTVRSARVSRKKRSKRRTKESTAIDAIVDYLKKHGECKNKDIQEYLEKIGIYQADSKGNQSSLSRLLSKESSREGSIIKKDIGGFVSLRK
jgi:hypothetical protein